MRAERDTEAGATYVYFRLGTFARTVDLGAGVLIDVDRRGRVLGVEAMHTIPDYSRVDALIADHKVTARG